MDELTRQVTFLMADDDADDRLLAERALQQCHHGSSIAFVEDGSSLLNYLLRRQEYSQPADAPRPQVIILDLNMPGMDGRQALATIKGDLTLRTIPIVVMSTSQAEEDIVQAYELGANAFITKPVSFEGLVAVMQSLSVFWFQTAKLPAYADGGCNG